MAILPELRFEIEDLYNAYVDALDDGPLESWPLLFDDPCDYRLVPRENYENDLPLAVMRCESRNMLMDRVVAVQELLMFEPRYLRHFISNLRVREVDDGGGRIQVVANYAVMETLPDDFTRILNSGRYFDEIIRDADKKLKFKSKVCVYDSELVPNSIVFPV